MVSYVQTWAKYKYKYKYIDKYKDKKRENLRQLWCDTFVKRKWQKDSKCDRQELGKYKYKYKDYAEYA